MTDEQMQSLFRTVADHLESLAISIQNVEDLQEQDRTRQEADRARQDADHARLDRLERLFKLMVRLGDRERKELRERINALIDAQMRSEAVFAQFQTQVAEMQTKSDERATRLEESLAQLAVGQSKADKRATRLEESLAQLAVGQSKADERATRLEEANAQFQSQIGVALSKLAEATAFAYQRLDALESPG